jgi:glycosyltransferase involved in cell wall biosynthesis
MISVVVNFYNNRREAPNTLYSLSSEYQKFDDFEVIVIDNGSSEPLDEKEVCAFGPQFKYRFIQNASKSPASVINQGVRDAIGDHVIVIIDGAHIITPGVYKLMSKAFKTFDHPFVATTPFHIGEYMQNDANYNSYNQEVEDKLMASVDWKANGYRLFRISTECADMSKGWFGCLFESGCYGLRRSDYLQGGGLDEQFTSPGGGMVSLDIFKRFISRPDIEYVMLIGEGSFHQYHGGVATSSPWEEHPWKKFNAEYESIRGVKYSRVPRIPFFMGSFRSQSLLHCKKTAFHGIGLWEEEFKIWPEADY